MPPMKIDGLFDIELMLFVKILLKVKLYLAGYWDVG